MEKTLISAEELKILRERNRELIEALKVLEEENETLRNKLEMKSLRFDTEEEAWEWLKKNDKVCKLLLANPNLSEFNFSIRTEKSLKKAGIETIRDLIRYNKKDLLKIEDIGGKSVSDVEDFLEDAELSFEFDVDSFFKKRISARLRTQI